MLGRSGGTRPGPAFGILMYHRVSPEVPGKPAPTWNVPPERFERQMIGLLERGFEAWPLRYVLDHHQKGLPIPRKAFVVTFDDGYGNVFQNAFPVLKRLKVPATVFLSTAYLDSDRPFPCDDWSVTGQADVPRDAWRPLTTDECSQMQKTGLIELGAHTHTHQDFRNRPEALRSDLEENVRELHERFGVEDATFAFPYGVKRLGFAGPPLNAVAREVGLLCSLSTEPELVRPQMSPFDWGRFNAEPYDTATSLAAKLQGWYETLRKAWKRGRQNPGEVQQ
jgi:peptidoglycan/xylan/chitin deacetylase (PgdA/CDA1 family)